jgi:hypothetical protein
MLIPILSMDSTMILYCSVGSMTDTVDLISLQQMSAITWLEDTSFSSSA